MYGMVRASAVILCLYVAFLKIPPGEFGRKTMERTKEDENQRKEIRFYPKNERIEQRARATASPKNPERQKEGRGPRRDS